MNHRLFKTLFWACAAVTLTAACSKDDDNADDDATTPRSRMLTIHEAAITRATLAHDGGTLIASWSAGDQVTALNITRLGDGLPTVSLTTNSTGMTSSFFGGKILCMNNDKLAVVHPTTIFNSDGSYVISLTGQDGTLATLGRSYYHLYGAATVTSSDATTATAMVDSNGMQPLLGVAHFTFKKGDQLVKANSFSVKLPADASGSELGAPLTYPQSATVTPSAGSTTVKAVPVASDKELIVNIPEGGLSDVYVAMLPTADVCGYIFTVDGNSYNIVTKLTAGKIVNAQLVVQ